MREEDFEQSGGPHRNIGYTYEGSAPSQTINHKLSTKGDMVPNQGHKCITTKHTGTDSYCKSFWTGEEEMVQASFSWGTINTYFAVYPEWDNSGEGQTCLPKNLCSIRVQSCPREMARFSSNATSFSTLQGSQKSESVIKHDLKCFSMEWKKHSSWNWWWFMIQDFFNFVFLWDLGFILIRILPFPFVL